MAGDRGGSFGWSLAGSELGRFREEFGTSQSLLVICQVLLLNREVMSGIPLRSITLSFAVLSLPLSADTFFVDFKADGANDGSSWKDAYTNLQAALVAAKPDDVVRIAEGAYFPDEGPGQNDDDPNSTFGVPPKVTLVGGYPTGGAASPSPLRYLTILSGDLEQNDVDPDKDSVIGSTDDLVGSNAYHVIRVSTETEVTISGVTLTAGNAGAGGASNLGGGALVDDGGILNLETCRFAGNHAGATGGAISSNEGFLSAINCHFSGNSSGSFGGAIFDNSGESEFTNCSFLGNTSAQAGGAVAVAKHTAKFTNVSFSGNVSGNGGGAIFATDSASLDLQNTIVWDNVEDDNTGNPDSSLTLDGGATVSFSHSLVHGLDLSGSSDGLDGTSNDNAPSFHLPPDPSDAPTSIGDLQLLHGSPGIDKGLNSYNSTIEDLAGQPRFIGDIDLGAFEFQRSLFVDDTATGSQHGGSWDNAFTKLQEALNEVEDGWTIHVARGVYYPDEGPGQTNNSQSASFDLIDGVTILGGYPNGGGIRNPGTQPTILSGDLQQNDIDPEGDKIAGPNDTTKVLNAINIVAAIGVDSSAVLDGFIITAGQAILNGSTYSNKGGALLIENASPTILSCNFTGNRASQYGGAVIISGASSQPSFQRCTFQSNSASGSGTPPQGGAIYCGISTSPTFNSCIFRGNYSGYHGGAISANEATVVMENCLFSGNRTFDKGGAIFLIASTLELTGCTFSANGTLSTSSGGAIYNGNSHVDAANSVLWNNNSGASTTSFDSSYSTNTDLGSTATHTFNHCLIQGRNLTNTGTGNLNGSLLTNDPLFAINATAHGSQHLDGDFHLTTGSPLANIGNNSLATQSTDLDGQLRIQSGTVEIGAYEGLDTDPDSDNDGLPDSFESANTSPSSSTSLDPAADDDGDGMDALTEFAFGFDPNQAEGSEAARWFSIVPYEGEDYPALTYVRGSNVTRHVRFIVEHSIDLGTGHSWSSVFMRLHQAGGNQFTYRRDLAIPEEPKQFLRVRVEKIEP